MIEPTRSTLHWPLTGVVLVIAITWTMDLTGLTAFSALPLFPLMLIFWWLQRFSRAEIGLIWGRPWHYGLAILYPLVVLGTALLVAYLAGATQPSAIDWQKVGKNFLLMSLAGIPILVLTEEGFFRGWLWASLNHSGQDRIRTLVWSSLAFAAWHMGWAFVEDGLDLAAIQALVYLTNAVLMGLVWGLLRWISGSIVVASTSHALWNGFAYPLFGAGPINGSLGIERKFLFDAETGVIGLALNLCFALALWTWWQRRSDQEN